MEEFQTPKKLKEFLAQKEKKLIAKEKQYPILVHMAALGSSDAVVLVEKYAEFAY